MFECCTLIYVGAGDAVTFVTIVTNAYITQALCVCMTCYSVTIYGNKTINLFWLTLHLPASVDFMIKSKLNSFILLCLFVLSQPVLIQSGSFIIPCGTDKNKRWLKKCLCLSLYRIIPLWKCSTEFSYPWFLNFLFVLVKCIFIKVSKLKISSVNVANRS